MDTNKNIYQKIFDARKFIAGQPLKKKGYNKFSDYRYYTPEQVDELALLAFEHTHIDAHFQLLKDELGNYGHLTVVNLENLTEKVEYVFRTDIPSIKATNITQQYGGAVTTTRRYLLQNLLSIFDADLDFDDSNSPIAPTNPKNLPNNNTPSNGNGNKPKTESNGNGKQDKPPSPVSESQVRLFWARAKEHGFTKEDVNISLEARGLKSVEDILAPDFNGWLERMRDKANSKQ